MARPDRDPRRAAHGLRRARRARRTRGRWSAACPRGTSRRPTRPSRSSERAPARGAARPAGRGPRRRDQARLGFAADGGRPHRRHARGSPGSSSTRPGDLVWWSAPVRRWTTLQATLAEADQQLALDCPSPDATRRRDRRHQHERPASAALRHGARPPDRGHVRPRRRRCREGRRQGRQERRRVRLRQAPHRELRHARARHPGRVPAAPAALGTSQLLVAEVPGRDEAGRVAAAVVGSQVVASAVEVDQPADRPVTVAVLLEGTEPGVAGRAATVAKLLGAAPRSTSRRRGSAAIPSRPTQVGLKLTTEIAGLATAAGRRTTRRAAAMASPIDVRGSAAGVLYAGMPQMHRRRRSAPWSRTCASAAAVVRRERRRPHRAGRGSRRTRPVGTGSGARPDAPGQGPARPRAPAGARAASSEGSDDAATARP